MWECPKCGRKFIRADQQHYCGKPETVDAYILTQDPALRPRLERIREIIREAIPEAEECISWSMPTYRKGRNLIHFAAAKKHTGLYPGDQAGTVFEEDLKGFDVSKGTIRLPHDRDLPEELIARIARWCYETYADQRVYQGGAQTGH